MTIEEKLHTEVITTEQAIYCLQNIEDADGDKCDDCPYVDVCSEKGIEGRIAQMAINALEENEGLKAQIKGYEHDIRVLGARTEVLLVANNAVNEKIQKAREEIDKADEDLDGYDPHALDTYIARVVEILDKYLGEAKDDKSDRNK